MKVLIADKLASSVVDSLSQDGWEVVSDPTLTADDLPGKLSDVDVLIVRSTRVTRDAIEAAGPLGLVIRAGSGVNTIDVESASHRGIHVANCPGKNADAVAELAIGLLIAADRQIANSTFDLRAGLWKKGDYGKARGLKTRTLGLLGFGAIGQSVARRALGLEMKVLAWSRSLDEQCAQQHGVTRADSPSDVMRQSDAVSVHLPLTDQTANFVNQELLDLLMPGAILINTSRGELVDEQALMAAIETKQLRVGLDVFCDEPAGSSGEFASTPLAERITATHHIGASTDQTSEAIADEVVRIVRVYRQTGRPAGSVNLCQKSPATHALTVRHLNQVGVLASVLDGLREENINVEEMENTIFDGAKAASCTLRLDASPTAQLLTQLETNDSILRVSLS